MFLLAKAAAAPKAPKPLAPSNHLASRGFVLCLQKRALTSLMTSENSINARRLPASRLNQAGRQAGKQAASLCASADFLEVGAARARANE